MPVLRAALKERQSRQKLRSRTVPVLWWVFGLLYSSAAAAAHPSEPCVTFRHIKLRWPIQTSRSVLYLMDVYVGQSTRRRLIIRTNRNEVETPPFLLQNSEGDSRNLVLSREMTGFCKLIRDIHIFLHDTVFVKDYPTVFLTWTECEISI